MRRRTQFLAALAFTLLAAGCWPRTAAPPPPATPAGSPSAASASAPAPAPRPTLSAPVTAPRARPTRNIFEYGDRQLPAGTPEPDSAPASLTARATPEPPVRLVALVRRAGRLLAALSVRGEVLVVGPGDVAGGYLVVAIDEDRGVQLRGPDGTGEILRP